VLLEWLTKKAKNESADRDEKGWDRTALSLEAMWGNPTAHKDLIGHKNLWLTKFSPYAEVEHVFSPLSHK